MQPTTVGLSVYISCVALSTVAAVTNRYGKVLISERVSSVEPDGITYTHSAGVEKIPFEDLPKAVQSEYGYSPRQAGHYSRSRMLSVTLSSAFPDGTALVTDNASGSMLYVSPAPEHKKSTVFMGGGTRWQLRLYQAGTFTFTDKSGQDRVVPRCATSWQWAESLLDAGQNVDTTADDNTKIELRRTWREQQERLSQLRAEEKERQARMDLLHRQTLAAERAAQAAQEEALARERIAGTLEQQRQDADIRARREQADRAEQNKALKRQADSLDEINWGMRQSRPVQIQEPSR